jgi:hypothetical protein
MGWYALIAAGLGIGTVSLAAVYSFVRGGVGEAIADFKAKYWDEQELARAASWRSHINWASRQSGLEANNDPTDPLKRTSDGNPDRVDLGTALKDWGMSQGGWDSKKDPNPAATSANIPSNLPQGKISPALANILVERKLLSKEKALELAAPVDTYKAPSSPAEIRRELTASTKVLRDTGNIVPGAEQAIDQLDPAVIGATWEMQTKAWGVVEAQGKAEMVKMPVGEVARKIADGTAGLGAAGKYAEMRAQMTAADKTELQNALIRKYTSPNFGPRQVADEMWESMRPS